MAVSDFLNGSLTKAACYFSNRKTEMWWYFLKTKTSITIGASVLSFMSRVAEPIVSSLPERQSSRKSILVE